MSDVRRTIAGRELRSLIDEKTILLAILIQLFVAAFSSFLVVGLVSLYDPGASGGGVEIETAIAGDDEVDLAAAAAETPGIVPVRYPSREAAAQAFANRQADAALLATRLDNGEIEVRVLVPDANVQTTVVVVQLQQVLRSYERGERAERAGSLTETTLSLPQRIGANPYLGFSYTVLVPLLLFLPVFIAGSITVDSLTEELDRGTMELLRVSPATVTEIIEGKLLAAAGLAPVQALAWMGLLTLNGTPVANLWSLLAVVTGTAAVVTVLGAGLAVVTPDRRAAQTIYSLAVLGVFGATALTPANPINVTARLAIDSAGAVEHAVAAGALVAGVVAVLFARRVVPRYVAAS